MRRTHSLVLVAAAFMREPGDPHWGYQLSKEAGVRSGVLYPILHRMLDEGWLDDGWEDPRELRDSRPPRRYYRVTPEGREALAELLASARSDSRFALTLRPALGGGNL